MSGHLILLSPSGNRVYAGENARLSAAELAIMLHGHGAPGVEPVEVAGVDYLRLSSEELDPDVLRLIGRQSSRLAVFRSEGPALLPVELPRTDRFDDDLVTIPKYPGKTNEQFTRLLLNVTAAAATRPLGPDAVVLDPLCGRGTTISTAWTLGWSGAGVESDTKTVEAYGAFLRTYLRRKRLRHTVDSAPVRRDGHSLGRRLDVTVTPADAGPPLTGSVFTGDTRDSAKLWGKKRFDLVVTDAPYGIVHASQSAGGKRKRSAADLLADAVAVWAGQLKLGGALGLAWNTHAITREQLVDLVSATGLQVCDEGPYRSLSHRVDSSINRDVLVAVKPS